MSIENITPQAWIEAIFLAKAAEEKGVVRRSIEDVEKYASSGALIRKVREYRFRMLSGGGQYLILCDPDGDFEIVI